MNTPAYEAILDDEGLEASHLLSIPPPSARWGAASLPFEKAGIKFLDTCDKPIPRHDIEPMEKITGVYLDQRLFLEAAKCGLFPFWIKPADPNLLPRWCISGIWEMSGGKRVILTEAELSKVHEKIDLAFLRHLLRLIPDHVAMRDNTALAHTNARNLICRFQFSAFVFQDRGLVMDLLVFGL